MLTREQLLHGGGRRYQDADIDGGTVRVAVMSGIERDDYLKSLIDNDEAAKGRDFGYKYRLLVKCLIDETGSRMFADDEAGVIATLPSDIIDKLLEIANEINGLTRKSVENLKKD